jgi:hypothetical protein
MRRTKKYYNITCLYVENIPLLKYLVDGQFLDLLSSGLLVFLGFLYIFIVAHTKSTYKTLYVDFV